MATDVRQLTEVPAQAAEGVEPGGSGTAREVLAVFTRLGLTSFGGPVAHLGYFRAELVQRRRWVDEETYAGIVALCQFLPGPASSQVGIAMGLNRAGVRGALAAWVGFTLPSALLMVLFAIGVGEIGDPAGSGWLRGLKIVAVAVVAQAVWGMAVSLCPDRPRATIAILAAVAILLWSTALGQVLTIVIAGAIGWRFLSREVALPARALLIPIGRRAAVGCWVVLGALLAGLPILREVVGGKSLGLADGFFRTGSLVFGGGHTVLPLLQEVVVPPGWVTDAEFVAGYGAAQAVPGPLFTFSAYLGQMAGGFGGAVLALVAVFAPSFLLLFGALPFWNALRGRGDFQAALRGINAAVVGILLAALYDPVWTSAVTEAEDVALVLICFGLLMVWKLPPWLVVGLAALGGMGLEYL